MATMTLDDILSTYRDGDEHGWDVEFDYLRTEHADRLAALLPLIARDGITEPILLGSDGRVWDGHHRLCIAQAIGLRTVPVRRA